MAKYVIEDTTLTNIASAIREKTGKSELLLPSQMPSEIQSISGGENLKLKDASYLFYNGARLDKEQELINNLDKPTNLEYIYYNVITKETIDFSQFDLSECEDLSYAASSSGSENFPKEIIINQNAPKLTSLKFFCAYRWGINNCDLSMIEPTNLVNCSNFFYNVRVSSFDNIKFPKVLVSNASSMFEGSQIENNNEGIIDISNLDFSKCTDFNNIFAGGANITRYKEIKGIIDMISNTSSINFPLRGKYIQEVQIKNLNNTVKLNDCTNLSATSINYLLNNIAEVTNKTLTLGETNIAKADESSIANATSKGWVIN